MHIRIKYHSSYVCYNDDTFPQGAILTGSTVLFLSFMTIHTFATGIQKSDFWPVHTDLEFFRPIYFMKNIFLSVRKMALFIYLTELNFAIYFSFYGCDNDNFLIKLYFAYFCSKYVLLILSKATPMKLLRLYKMTFR